MRIVDIRTRLFEKPLDGSLRNPRFVWTVKRSLLTFVTTDTGLVGVGESWVDGGDPASVAAFIERDLAPRLLGEDPRLPELHFRRALDMTQVSTRRSLTAAGMSAIDIALWDIKAQAAGEPLWRMLGGCDRRVTPYASGGLYKEGQSAADFAEEYAAFARRGFRGVKIKVGGAPVAVDVERVAKLREALGPGPMLMVDSVSNHDVPTALAFARAARRYDLTWFEQPVAIENVAGMARIQREGGIPVCGVENESGLPAFRRLMEEDAIHYVQFDPIVSGGVTFGRKIAALAEAFHRPVTLHHSNSVVSMLVNMHLAAALPNAHSVELHVVHQPLFDRAPAGTFDLTDGRLTAPDRPGLGVDARTLMT